MRARGREDQVHRCGGCGAWLHGRRPCSTCHRAVSPDDVREQLDDLHDTRTAAGAGRTLGR